ncbi:uncharacterized protein [Choristoneura fumiferana]|uniref:uncharacterized protein n=1 Tax=Choristoneura fumiferana TaxID=7141 RepID=UPI003D15EC17
MFTASIIDSLKHQTFDSDFASDKYLTETVQCAVICIPKDTGCYQQVVDVQQKKGLEEHRPLKDTGINTKEYGRGATNDIPNRSVPQDIFYPGAKPRSNTVCRKLANETCVPDLVESLRDTKRHGKSLTMSLNGFAPEVSSIHKKIPSRPASTKPELMVTEEVVVFQVYKETVV